MPIHLNLLAEYQAAEEQRRRDPVKRTIAWSCIGVGLVLAWAGMTQLQILNVTLERDRSQQNLASLEKTSGQVKTNLLALRESEQRLAALYALATNRFLWGSTLDALQRLATDGNIQITQIRSMQQFEVTKAVTTTKPAKPATAIERMAMTIQAKDLGRPTDQSYVRFKEGLANYPYFQTLLVTNGVNLVEFSAPQPDSSDPSRTFVTFSLECRFPDKTRTR